MFQFFGLEAWGILALASLLNLLQHCFWFMFRFSAPGHARSQLPQEGANLHPCPGGGVFTTGLPGKSQKVFQGYDFQVSESFSYLRPRISHNLYRQNKILTFLRKASFIVFERECLVCPALSLSGSKDCRIYKYSSVSTLNPQYWNYVNKLVCFGFLSLAMKNLLFLTQRTLLVITSRSVRTRRVIREGRVKRKEFGSWGNLPSYLLGSDQYQPLVSVPGLIQEEEI